MQNIQRKYITDCKGEQHKHENNKTTKKNKS